jgi:hypothetical protein
VIWIESTGIWRSESTDRKHALRIAELPEVPTESAPGFTELQKKLRSGHANDGRPIAFAPSPEIEMGRVLLVRAAARTSSDADHRWLVMDGAAPRVLPAPRQPEPIVREVVKPRVDHPSYLGPRVVDVLVARDTISFRGAEFGIQVGDNCRIPIAGYQRAATELSRELCERHPHGIQFRFVVHPGVPTARYLELINVDPRPEACRIGPVGWAAMENASAFDEPECPVDPASAQLRPAQIMLSVHGADREQALTLEFRSKCSELAQKLRTRNFDGWKGLDSWCDPAVVFARGSNEPSDERERHLGTVAKEVRSSSISLEGFTRASYSTSGGRLLLFDALSTDVDPEDLIAALGPPAHIRDTPIDTTDKSQREWAWPNHGIALRRIDGKLHHLITFYPTTLAVYDRGLSPPLLEE